MTLSRTHRRHPKPKAEHNIKDFATATLINERNSFTKTEIMARFDISQKTFSRIRQALNEYIIAVSMPGGETVYEFRSG